MPSPWVVVAVEKAVVVDLTALDPLRGAVFRRENRRRDPAADKASPAVRVRERTKDRPKTVRERTGRRRTTVKHSDSKPTPNATKT